MATINAPIGPGFSLNILKGANAVVPCTIYDRAGNVKNLIGFAVRLTISRKVEKSNGAGQLTVQTITLSDESALALAPELGNVNFVLRSSVLGTPGIYQASVKLWSDGVITNSPSDAYAGTITVEEGAN